MKISRISVEDLFYTYTYTIQLSKKPVSIIHAPNGYGKTTVFKLIRDIFNLDIKGLYEIPFKSFSVELDNGQCINLTKNKPEPDQIDREPIKMTFTIVLNNKQEKSIKLQVRESIIDFYKGNYFHPPYFHSNERILRENKEIIDEIEKIREDIAIHFIETNRLYFNNNSAFSLIDMKNDYEAFSETDFRRKKPNSSIELNDRIVYYANNLKNKINQVKQEYSSFSESLDRTFPSRLVDSVNLKKQFYDEETIECKLKELDRKRAELEEIGFISKETSSAPIQSLKNSDDTLKRFYTLYIDDTLSKLNYYNNIKEKIKLFFEIINVKTAFSNKELLINNDGKVYFMPKLKKQGSNTEIQLQKLSSGEKHDFILFYELIFNSDKKSIFLIDEPEISLHVAWQVEYVKILEEICKMNGIQAIIATHSPDIVNGRDDLLISLGLEDEENG